MLPAKAGREGAAGSAEVALLGTTSLVLAFSAFYAGTTELAAAPGFLVGFATGLLTVAAGALLYLTCRKLGGPRR